MKRSTLTIQLMSGIALLLAARGSISLYEQAPADIPMQVTIEQAMPDQPIARQTDAGMAIEDENSLVTLEQYLFPQAQAAATEAMANAIQGDDETLKELRAYKEQLDNKAQSLEKREKALSEAEANMKQRITELEQLEASIQQRLNDEQKVKSKKIKRLTAVYEGMKPEKAAPVLTRMELETVVKIFLLMDEKKVGKILAFMPPEKAVVISQALTRQISTVK